MLIRPSTVDDAEALADLHLDVWDEAYVGLVPAEFLAARRANRASRVDRWRDILVSGTSTELLAQEDEDGGRLLGFASTSSGRDDPEPNLPDVELMGLYVRAEVYGTGVGYALMKAAISNAAAYLWVLEGNASTIRFYERQGFRFDGKIKTDPLGVERRMVRRVSV